MKRKKVVLVFEGETVAGMVAGTLGARRSAREGSTEGPGMAQVEWRAERVVVDVRSSLFVVSSDEPILFYYFLFNT